MREYKKQDGFPSPYSLRLCPEDGNQHFLGFTNEDSRHKFWLALRLGTYPDPDSDESKWSFVEEDAGLELLIPREYLPDEDPPDDCCQSGCKGCPNFRI